MNNTIKWIIGIIIVIAIIWFGFIKSDEPTSNEPIKIGVILPLTGDLATYAEGTINAINLAVENSGFADQIQLIIEDDKTCTPTNDVSSIQKLIGFDKINGLIGPFCSSATLSVAPITEKNKLVVISPTASSKSITTAGDYIFRVIASDADKSVAMAQYAYNKGYRKAAFIFDTAQDAMVQQKLDAKETFVNLGGIILVDQSYSTGDRDFRSQLTAIKQSDADAIFIAGVPKETSLIIKQSRELGIKLPFIATETSLGTQDMIDVAGIYAEGLVFPFATTPNNKESNDFIDSYKEKYGVEPPAYAAEGYDAAMLMIKSIVASKDRTGDNIKKELEKIGQNYQGASGVITFDENGDVQKPMVIKMIENGQFVEIK